MIIPKDLEDLARYIEDPVKTVFFFSADWCGDCRYIEPYLPALEEEHADFRFVKVDRDIYLDVAKAWNVFGIPSMVVLQDGKELGRYVDRHRKTKAELDAFLNQVNIQNEEERK